MSHLTHEQHMFHLSHSIWFDDPNNIWKRV